MTVLLSLCVLMLFAAGAIAAYQFSDAKRWRETAHDARMQAERYKADLDAARIDVVHRQGESVKHRELAEAQLKLLTQTQRQLEEKFRALANEALQSNSQLFLDRSKEQMQHLVEPVNQSLRKFEDQVRAIEISRAGAYADLTAQVQTLTSLQERVRQSTDQLKAALRSPTQRGRWGELQLRRVVELAGMLEYCDFSEQKTLFGETNQRPDLIVRLPNQCQVVVDSKVSLEAYLRGIEAQDDTERTRLFADHARQVRSHVKSLGEKAYWERLTCSPDFVIAFLPLEPLFSTALEHDPTLLDFGVEKRVVIATPMTLISLLLVIAHGWRQHALADNLDKIRDSGQELYARLLKMNEHFSRLGEAIEKTVSSYNQTVGSLEQNVLPSARKFKELRPANAEQLQELAVIDATPRGLSEAKWKVLGQTGT